MCPRPEIKLICPQGQYALCEHQLECVDCPPNSSPTPDLASCTCDAGYFSLFGAGDSEQVRRHAPMRPAAVRAVRDVPRGALNARPFRRARARPFAAPRLPSPP